MADNPVENESQDLDSLGIGQEQLALSLEDLLPDAEGNVVLFNDAGVTEMAIVTEKTIINSGVAGNETIVEGGDVSGMVYYSFDAGPTLYCPVDVHISVIPETV